MARPRRRHGRGGGAPFTGVPDGLQPGDDVGNRRSFKQTQHPPDNLGNKRDLEEEAWMPNDDVGNRVDAAPTHEISGVLADLGGRGRRRKKGGQPHQRMGRYIVGGVNPVVAGNVQRAVEAMREADERKQLERGQQRANGGARSGGVEPGLAGAALSLNGVDEEGRRGRRRRRRRRDGREQVDGQAAQEVSERRAQRFFDFEEDDRFEYVLKSDREQKRLDAHAAVANVLTGAGRDAVVVSRVLDDDNRPKVIVTIDERGPQGSLPEERRGRGAGEPLFVLGNAALMSLNYLVNKIVNRYPDDRIRLAILPAADEKLYLESLEEHRRQQRVQQAEPQAEQPAEPSAEPSASTSQNGAAGRAEPAPAAHEPPLSEEPPASAALESARPAALPEEPAAPAQSVEPKAKRTRTTKVKAAKKAPQDDDTGADDSAAAPAAADDEPAPDAGARKATKKKASAKVSARSRSTDDGDDAPAAKKVPAKKATAKKATAKKATAKKSAPRKKTSSEG